jgi:hypothetical protein
MAPINVGFKSNHWIKLTESSKEHQLIVKAFEDGNQEAMAHSYNAMDNVEDTVIAMTHAKKAVQSAMVGGDNQKHSVECPFCLGKGNLDITYTSRRDPDRTKDVSATCSACAGDGTINVDTVFNEYADEVYPENAISAIISKDYNTAKQVAIGMFKQIDGYRNKIEEDSLDRHLRY